MTDAEAVSAAGTAAAVRVAELPGSDSGGRCAQVAGLVRRSSATGPVAEGDAPALLDALWRRGQLAFERADGGTVDASYVPSLAALHGLERPAAVWQPVHKRHAKQVRAIPGAVFHCPVDADPHTGTLDLFITDWSPCPSACAVAIHRWHPFARQERAAHDPHFTGRYVRHPLTGDLLPVWVADWVKPEFGTGAVLVNPGHSDVDLAFARGVGLPVRFALSRDPAQREQQPPVSGGSAIRTGEWDGLTSTEASEAYLSRLTADGLAEATTMPVAGSFRVATLLAHPDGEARWCPRTGRLERAAGPERHDDAGSMPVRVRPDPALTAAAAGGRVLVVAARSALERDVLALRLLAAEDVTSLEVERLVPVAEVDAPADPDPAAALARLVVSAPGEAGAVRKQLLEQCARFHEQHAGLLARARPDGDVEGPRAAALVKQHLAALALPQAFRELYRLQKDLATAGATPSPRHPYFALATVLAGVDAPAGSDVAGRWREL